MWTLLDSRRAAALNDNPDTGDDLGGDSQEWLLGSSPLRHVEVYQAAGMIIAQLEVSAETALATLRGYAFAHGRALAEVAHEVVTRRFRFEEDTL